MRLISVIVPVYKVEKYLCSCVDSILAQTFSDFELVLVDDGSPDGCPAICDEYALKDDRVCVIHKENGGLSSARNAGIEAAVGEYLLFVDSDDMIHPDALRSLLDAMRQTGAQIATGAFDRFSGDMPTENSIIRWDGGYHSVSGVEAMRMVFEPWKYRHNMVSSCCKLFPREYFDDVRFPLGRLFEDEFTVHKLYAKAETVALVDNVTLYFYFSNDNGITGKLTLRQWLDAYDARYERVLFFEENGFDELYDVSLKQYLRWAQWDLIKCRKNEETVEEDKKQHFERQFKDIFERARKRKVINLSEHFDYYMLAKPKLGIWWRLRRKWIKQ